MTDYPPITGRKKFIVLTLMVLIVVSNFMDRTIIATSGLAIKEDLGLSDAQLGILQGLAFALLYTAASLPAAWLAERNNRVKLLSAAVALWSAMTALCGGATSFVQLAFLRMGVGLGEGACNPPLQSLLADYFPKERRTFAISIVSCGIPIGIAAGSIFAGFFTDTLGWRMAFVVLGAPGILLAILSIFLLPEPRGDRQAQELARQKANEIIPSVRDVVKAMTSSRPLLLMILGSVLSASAFSGMTGFAVPFFVRSFEMSFTSAGFLLGLTIATAQLAGLLLGGLVTERAAAKNVQWQPLAPGIGLFLSGILGILAFQQTTMASAAAVFFLAMIPHFSLAPTMAFMHAHLAPRMRATGTAIFLMAVSLGGTATGPIIVGVLADIGMGTMEPGAATGFALSVTASIFILGGLFFVAAARRLSPVPFARLFNAE